MPIPKKTIPSTIFQRKMSAHFDKNYWSNNPDDDVDDEDCVDIIPTSSKATLLKSTTDLLFTNGRGCCLKRIASCQMTSTLTLGGKVGVGLEAKGMKVN
jgi:hypothetical protein